MEDIESIEQRKATIEYQNLAVADEEDIEPTVSDPVEEKLKYALEFFDPELFDFVRDEIGEGSVCDSDAVFLDLLKCSCFYSHLKGGSDNVCVDCLDFEQYWKY